MGRPDKKDVQLRRSRQAVDTALSRGRFAAAAEALVLLPAEARAFALADISRGMTSELLRAGLDKSAAVPWLSWVEKEPRLLPTGEAGQQVRWVLLLVALHVKQWPRVRSYFASLEPALCDSASYLQLSALVAADGRPDGSSFSGVVDADFERLGYTEKRSVATYALPESVDAVERACCECLGCEPWSRFREVVAAWRASLGSEAMIRELGRVSALLSQRELLRRSEPRAKLEVARFCAAGCIDAGAPAELEPIVARCLQVLSRSLVVGPQAAAPRASARPEVSERTWVESALSIAAAAQHYPKLAPLMLRVALHPRYAGQALEPAERLLRTLIGDTSLRSHAPPRASTSLELMLAGAKVFLERTAERNAGFAPTVAPPWLVSAMETLLAEPTSLAAALGAVVAVDDPKEQGRIVGLTLDMLDLLPMTLVQRSLDELWELVREEPVRGLLVSAADDLLTRMREASRTAAKGPSLAAVRAMAASLGLAEDDMSDAELRRLLRSPEGRLLENELELDESARLSAAMRELWQPLSSRLFSYRPRLLEAAVELASTEQQRNELVDRFWESRVTLLSRVEALRLANQEASDDTVSRLTTRLTTQLAGQQLDTARALIWAEQHGAPDDVCRQIAKYLHGLVERDGSPDADDVVLRALRLAKTWVRPPRKKKAATKKRASKVATTAGPTGDTQRGSRKQTKPVVAAGEQLELILGSEAPSDV